MDLDKLDNERVKYDLEKGLRLVDLLLLGGIESQTVSKIA